LLKKLYNILIPFIASEAFLPKALQKGGLEKGRMKEGLIFFEGREGKEKEGLVQKILLRRKNVGRYWF